MPSSKALSRSTSVQDSRTFADTVTFSAAASTRARNSGSQRETPEMTTGKLPVRPNTMNLPSRSDVETVTSC
ncbi:hypothetical protein B9W64_35855 [Streptomyces sp. CS159]|nr:hypothetical protein B9W64_35855 [Streptomyces sp. CS159]